MKYTFKLLWNLTILLGRVGWILGGFTLGMLGTSFALMDHEDENENNGNMPHPKSDLCRYEADVMGIDKKEGFDEDGRMIVG